jgi:serine/threonine protein kinase
VNPFDLVIQHSALNFSVSLIVLISIGAAQIKYSGIPYISEKAQKLMKKVLSVILAWSFGIIIHGILYLIREENLLSQSSNLSGTESGNSVTTVIFIFDLLVTEVICFIFVNEFSFFEIFSLEIDDFPRLPLIEPLTPVDYAAPKMDLNIRVEDLVFKEEFSGDRNKMGTLFIGLFKDQEVLIRKLHLSRINNYVTEKIYEDLASLSSICCPHFSSPLGVCIHGEYVEIVLSYFKQGSLFHNLHKKRITYNEKLKIAREIAFCVKIIHNMEQVHGHLTSLNVMLDGANRAYVTDLGLAHLKKFCAITSGYCNKSAWSSPQILNEAGNVANKASSYDDVYSFGIILWEIITDDTPFPAVNIKKLQNMLNQGFRPGIPVNVDKDLAELMKSCWNIEPKNRPSFDLIHNTLCLVLARENGTESFFSAEGF